MTLDLTEIQCGIRESLWDTGFGQNTERDLGNVIGTRDLASTRAAGFDKIWERMRDWERKRYWGCDRSSGPPFPDPQLRVTILLQHQHQISQCEKSARLKSHETGRK